eukprot:30870-Pelagococcus_subviridis.AAC.2
MGCLLAVQSSFGETTENEATSSAATTFSLVNVCNTKTESEYRSNAICINSILRGCITSPSASKNVTYLDLAVTAARFRFAPTEPFEVVVMMRRGIPSSISLNSWQKFDPSLAVDSDSPTITSRGGSV